MLQSAALFVRSKMPSALDIDLDQLGEQALKDTKEHRELQHRLQDIEQELRTMTQAVEMEVRLDFLWIVSYQAS